MLQNMKNIAQKCMSYDIQKVLISGLLNTTALTQDFTEQVSKLITNICHIEVIVMSIMIISLALIFVKMAYTCWTRKTLGNNFVFNVIGIFRCLAHFIQMCS